MLSDQKETNCDGYHAYDFKTLKLLILYYNIIRKSYITLNTNKN